MKSYATHLSDCCSAPVNPDVPICTQCREWCDIYDADDAETDSKGS